MTPPIERLHVALSDRYRVEREMCVQGVGVLERSP